MALITDLNGTQTANDVLLSLRSNQDLFVSSRVTHMHKTPQLAAFLILSTFAAMGVDECAVNQGGNQDKPVDDPDSVPIAVEHSDCQGVTPGEVWDELTFEVGPLAEGYKVLLAGKPDGTGDIHVDDRLEITCLTVDKHDKPLETVSADDIFAHDFFKSCDQGPEAAGPFDVTYLFDKTHSVECKVRFKDVCGVCEGSSDIWLAWVDVGAQIEAAEETQSTANKYSFGLGVDAHQAVVSQHWATLRDQWKDDSWNGNPDAWGLRTARTVYYVGDIEDAPKFESWLNAVQAHGLEPVVTVSVRNDWDHIKAPVSRSDFRGKFEALLTKYKAVRYWGVINEPDLELDGTSNQRAVDAAEYFVHAARALRKCKLEGKCDPYVSLIAGEFANQGNWSQKKNENFWKHYRQQLTKAMRRKTWNLPAFPLIWGLHPYIDSIDPDGNLEATKRFLKFLKETETHPEVSKATGGLKEGALRAWLTETGVLLYIAPNCYDPNGDAAWQFDGASRLFEMNDYDRVDRIYWWHFQQGLDMNGHGLSWDSAMVAHDNIPRPSFCALTKQNVSCGGLDKGTLAAMKPSGALCP